ncbi:hypothetical protein C0Z18_03340 [Trinickia dabaoshanensis]|uniref:Uncharacterized protein n=1 Tax=Trinickia dabaoshanensis TaxID=564714 RepID=A0A2N7W1I9_9BURK|nr:hypothetical protein C0Z18_03340 [Trinickia dabaoshanensis]
MVRFCFRGIARTLSPFVETCLAANEKAGARSGAFYRFWTADSVNFVQPCVNLRQSAPIGAEAEFVR